VSDDLVTLAFAGRTVAESLEVMDEDVVRAFCLRHKLPVMLRFFRLAW
jgi:hypothetical protein